MWQYGYELLTSNCKKLKVFEEMDLRKEQFWQMKELQNKNSREKNDVSGSDKNDRNVKDFRILSVNSTLPNLCIVDS
jgi:hypothetical protein